MKGKTFHFCQFFLTLQDWQHCKKDLVSSQKLFVDKLYNAGIHLNLSEEICASRPLVLIPIKSDKAGLEQFGASGKEEEAGSNASYTTTTTNAFTTTSAATPPKVGFFSDTLCDNLQSANRHALMPSSSPKSVFDNEILSSKADLFTLCIIFKLAFVEEVDDDDNDTNFEHTFRVCIVSSGDNQTHQSVMGRNIIGLLDEQGLSGAESSKQKQLDK